MQRLSFDRSAVTIDPDGWVAITLFANPGPNERVAAAAVCDCRAAMELRDRLVDALAGRPLRNP